VCRPSLHLAPGVLAPSSSNVWGRGRQGTVGTLHVHYRVRTRAHAVTSGATSEELEKRIAAELMEGRSGAVYRQPEQHGFQIGPLASAINERPARVRLLGKSQMLPL